MTQAIRLDGVAKAFGPKVAVENLDLVIPQGCIYGFIGPNGAGKTTTIRMIMSIIFPDRGTISVLGAASAVERKDRIGYLPEERGLYRKMKVGAFLNFMGRLKGLDGAGLETRVRGWLDRMSLGDCYRKRCEELSKGMQQKVQFIAAVIHEPDLIILDEPFSGLDPVNRRLLRQLIDEQHQQGRTLIFSTHAMFEAEQLCTHLFMIHRGRKVLDMPMEEVWKSHDPRVVVVEGVEEGDASSWAACDGVDHVHKVGRAWHLHLHDGVQASDVIGQAARLAPLRRAEVKRANLEEIFIGLVGGDDAALRLELEEAQGLEARTAAGSGGDA
ncbi:MAG: ATP-binding cassette domain-containing protein [Phycisphaeraceae bacterium]|nr:ATP-binding cassette domain-containing protein [Phycisphaeraceae bacterium]